MQCLSGLELIFIANHPGVGFRHCQATAMTFWIAGCDISQSLDLDVDILDQEFDE